jgi:hypothetical protein
MNLGRYTVSTPSNPAFASISFTESVPLPAEAQRKEPSAKAKGKQRETLSPAPRDGDEGKERKKSRRNGHFMVVGEEGFEVWSNAPELQQLLRRSRYPLQPRLQESDVTNGL